jgi:hypothetical protein
MTSTGAAVRMVVVFRAVATLCVCPPDGISRTHERSEGDALEEVQKFIIVSFLWYVSSINNRALNGRTRCSSRRQLDAALGSLAKAGDDLQVCM